MSEHVDRFVRKKFLLLCFDLHLCGFVGARDILKPFALLPFKRPSTRYLLADFLFARPLKLWKAEIWIIENKVRPSS